MVQVQNARDSSYHQQGEEKLVDRGDERQTLCLGGQRLLGPRPLQAESGSITRVQGRRRPTTSEAKGHHQLPVAPFLLWEGWGEDDHRRVTAREKKPTGDGQKELCNGLSLPIVPIFLPTVTASQIHFLFRGSGGAAMNTARCEWRHEKPPGCFLNAA